MDAKPSKAFRFDAATALAAIIIVSSVVAYLSLNLIYNVEDVDDAWSLSFIYNALVRHIPPAATFGGGMADLTFFGKTQAYAYAFVLGVIGWTKYNAHLVSTLFMMLCAPLWYGTLRRLGFSARLALLFASLVLWCEPFFREGLLSRPESITFFLVSAGFFFFARAWYFPAVFLGCVAVENHPMGVVFFVYAFALAAASFRPGGKIPRRTLARYGFECAGGALLGAAYFIVLHHGVLGGTGSHVAKGFGLLHGTVLSQYFFICVNYYRHVLDFCFFFACLAVYFFRGYYRDNRFVLAFLCIVVAASFLVPHANYHYTLYFYPALLLMALFTFEKLGRMEWAAAFLYLIFLAYDASVVYRKRHYDFNDYVKKVTAAVPADSLPVVGSPNDWFAFKDRAFYPAICTFIYDSAAPALYVVAGNDYRNGIPGAPTNALFRDTLSARYSGTILKTFLVNKEEISIFLMKKNR
jgi:hypothetical protein